MKKLLWYAVATLTTLALLVSCKNKEDVGPDEKTVATLAQAELVNAAASAYAAWEEDNLIPGDLTVGSAKLTLPQYQEALARLVVAIAASDKSEIKVKGFKAADHPDRDSYDQKEIAVTGGGKISEGTEDLADLAKRFVATMEEKLTVPNQTLVTRAGSSALAFSTNRLTVTMLRALAAYKSGASFPKSISTEYLSSAATLKGFAQQFVGILDIWEKTVGTVSADGSHCTDNNSAWQDVHFVPIPWSGGYSDGVDQYDAKYQPYFTVTIDGKTYSSAQTWGVALRGIMNLITKEGASTFQQERNTMIHTLANGGSLKDPIPPVDENDIWGQYPWYESTNDGVPINLASFDPYLIVRTAAWFLTRQQALGKIGNYQIFLPGDPDNGFVEEGVNGFVSAMRMWLIAARFYKYLLDNNITDNVYDAVKNVRFDTDLYGVEMPDINVKETSISLPADGSGVSYSFSSKAAWTMTTSDGWIQVNPSSGAAGDITVMVSATPNTGEAREGKIVLKGGNVDGIEIDVRQSKYIAPSEASLKEFAREFVNGLQVWEATVGTVESESEHLIEKGTAWENVHFIPVGKTGGDYDSHEGNQYDDKYTPWVLNVAGKQYTSSEAWEIAIRGLLNMVTIEGEAFLNTMDDRNKPYTLGNNQSFGEAPMPNHSDGNKWGGYPWYEGADSDLVTYNGAPIETVDLNFMVKVGSWHVVRSFIAVGSNNPLGNVGNFQQFGTSSSTLKLDGYEGLISPMRELLVLMRIYKYLLDNNVNENVYDALKDQKFDFDLYNQGSVAKKYTVKDFAQEYVKILDIWQNTTGTIDMLKGEDYDGGEFNVENAHYVPSTTTITVGNKSYNTADMWETALRCYLLVRGYDGLDTEHYGKNSIAPLEGGARAMSETDIPETHGYYFGSSPYNETPGNGGHLVMGSDGNGEHCKVKLDILDNWAMRSLNFQHGQTITNLCGYSGGQLDGYYGCFCSMRGLLTYAFFFKYMLDNNLDKADAIPADTIFRTELFGDE